MKFFLASILLLVVAGCATAPAQPVATSHEETLKNDTAGVILITLDDEPSIFIFVSKTGKVLATAAEVCAHDPQCGELAQRMGDEGKANMITLHSAKPDGTQTALPRSGQAPLPKSASWDQENLKRDDHGCPTAIYIAPNGELHQC